MGAGNRYGIVAQGPITITYPADSAALRNERERHAETRADRDRWVKRVKELEAQLQRVREVVR